MSDDSDRDRRAESALATSSPDFNWSVLNLARYLFRVGREKPWLAPVAWTFGALLALSVVFFVTALPSLNGLTIWADKKAEADAAERAFELDKLRVTAEIEASKAAAERETSDVQAEILQSTKQTELTTRAIGEQLDRIDGRVTRIEEAHPNLREP